MGKFNACFSWRFLDAAQAIALPSSANRLRWLHRPGDPRGNKFYSMAIGHSLWIWNLLGAASQPFFYGPCVPCCWQCFCYL